eukprot:TRINITY_DN27576_c0_g1_i1.p1 TRINITY_DN27576_c0_g1~~TRINITY_DN27576_c0_g1_i1.p1  ORF type:complete len:130 (-),score=33.11 TRINITY_DN27576_c0_g1_i1:105-494(-)
MLTSNSPTLNDLTVKFGLSGEHHVNLGTTPADTTKNRKIFGEITPSREGVERGRGKVRGRGGKNFSHEDSREFLDQVIMKDGKFHHQLRKDMFPQRGLEISTPRDGHIPWNGYDLYFQKSFPFEEQEVG